MSDPGQARRRRIYNPVQDDAVTFLETSEESGGERTLGELEVASGGKVTPHYHLGYTERFAVIEGQLNVRLGDVHHVLVPGEELTVPTGTVHAWSNASAERTVAHIELRPGQPGFETSLRVIYGLAADGKVLKNGLPRNPLHAALLLEWGETRLPAPTRSSSASCACLPASPASPASTGNSWRATPDRSGHATRLAGLGGAHLVRDGLDGRRGITGGRGRPARARMLRIVTAAIPEMLRRPGQVARRCVPRVRPPRGCPRRAALPDRRSAARHAVLALRRDPALSPRGLRLPPQRR